MDERPFLMIAAGGTGGHMFPAQALAEEMLSRGWRVCLSTDRRGFRYAGGFPESVRTLVVSSGTFSRGRLQDRVLVPVLLLAGTLSALRRIRRDRPRVVAGFGGYPAAPTLAAARLARIPTMLHEQNGVLGRVNRLFAARVERIACSVWPMELPRGASPTVTGNPVRGSIRRNAGACYVLPGDDTTNILVIGGSQGARVLSTVVPAALAGLPRNLASRLSVAQQARDDDVDEVVSAYRAAGVRAEVRPFFRDIADRIAAAQLVISRSGASSVAEIAAIGRPAVFIPLAAAIRDEQTHNARALAGVGGAVLVTEAELSPERLAAEITAIICDPARAGRMAAAAASAGRPEAAEALADVVEELAGGELRP